MSLRGSRTLVAGLASLVVFLVVAAMVFSGITQSADAALALLINNASLGAPLSSLMVALSHYGREYFWIPIVAIMLVFGGRETKLLGLELAVLFLVGIAFGEALKYLAYRERPYQALSGIVLRMPGDTDSSFPSGHALIVTIGASFCLAKFRHKSLALLLTLEAALVCYSRVYTGLHYPLDVLAGIALGVAIVGIGSYLMRAIDPVLRRIAALLVRAFRGSATF